MISALDEIADQLAYLREQNAVSGFHIWLRVSSAGASFMLLEPSTKEVAFVSPPVEVTGSREFRCALNAAIGAAIRQDGKIAERAREQVHAISDAWHIYSEGRATKLFVHPSDEVILPYIVATNRGMDGPLRFCGMTVLYDSFYLSATGGSNEAYATRAIAQAECRR